MLYGDPDDEDDDEDYDPSDVGYIINM